MARYDLARFRRDQGITQKQLADILQVTQGFMSSVENGRNPFPEERRKLFDEAFPTVDLERYRQIEDVALALKLTEDQKRMDFILDVQRAIADVLSQAGLNQITFSENGGTNQACDAHELERLRDTMAALERRNDELNAEVSRLRSDNARLHGDNEILQAKLLESNSKFSESSGRLFTANERIYELQEENMTLRRQVFDLEAAKKNPRKK